MAHKSGSNKALKIVVEEVSKDGYRTIIFDRQPIKWIEILTEWGEILFEGKTLYKKTVLPHCVVDTVVTYYCIYYAMRWNSL